MENFLILKIFSRIKYQFKGKHNFKTYQKKFQKSFLESNTNLEINMISKLTKNNFRIKNIMYKN